MHRFPLNCLVKRFLVAACLGPAFVVPVGRAAAQGANTSLIKLTYRCDNWFRVRNSNTVDVPVIYSVYRTTETGNLTLPAAPPSIGYSDTWFHTTNRGAVLLTYNGARVAEKPNADVACATVASMGQWTDTLYWPIMAVHADLLPNGKVLTWGREYANKYYTIPPPGPNGSYYNGIPNIWDPTAGNSSAAFTFVDAGADLFCAGAAFLADGRLLVAGGATSTNGENTGQRYAYIFNYQTNTWTQTPNMADGRWYPSVVTLTNGTAFIMSGTDTTGAIDSIPEVYNPTTNTFAEDNGWISQTPYWAFVYSGPNGNVFYAGDQGFTYYVNPTPPGQWLQGFWTQSDTTRSYGSAVMYDAGKILIVGGGNTLSSAETINLNNSSPQWQYTGSMHFPRRQMNAVLLANGEVMASGGSAGPDFNPATNIVYTPEIWNPATGVWTEMPNYQVPRLYHSETLLLTDGRVLSVGGGQPAATGLSDNFNAEIYSPPYLFNPDGSAVTASRPVIAAAPSSVGYNSNFSLTVQNVAGGTASVLWIRLGSVTHAINLNQRLNHLTSSQTGTTLTVTTPASANLAPPGHYLLFVLNANGVPSVGTIIQIQ
jgi:galactose oxidase